MKIMKKFFGAALLAGAAVGAFVGTAGTASAEGTLTANVAVTTDYIFRGITQSGGSPAVQGGFDYVDGTLYAGTWLSSISFSSGPEMDLYAGWTPTVGPVALNLGVLGYFYPGASDDSAEFDYYEAKATATITPFTGFSLTGSAYYSPDFFGETGNALYLELAGAYTVSDKISVSGAYGNQKIDDPDGPTVPGSHSDSYNTWNLGLTYALGNGYSIDGRYSDTDIDANAASPSITDFALPDGTAYDSAFVLTLKKTM